MTELKFTLSEYASTTRSNKNRSSQDYNQFMGLCRCGNETVEGKKRCQVCLDSNQKKRRSHRDKGLCDCGNKRLDGRRKCLDCTIRNRISSYKQRYNLTIKQYEEMLESQENKCAICDIEFTNIDKHTTPHIDHNHETGEVRGLLCDLCNLALGHMKNDTMILLNAISYLTYHNKEK